MPRSLDPRYNDYTTMPGRAYDNATIGEKMLVALAISIEALSEQSIDARTRPAEAAMALLEAARKKARRLNMTVKQVVDLKSDYELVWRIGGLVQLGLAGIAGRHWLVMDALLQCERVRVRVAGLISGIVLLKWSSYGRGRRSLVHYFGTFARALTSACDMANPGVGVGWDKAVGEAY